MARPSRIYIDKTALLHNVKCVRQSAPGKKIIAMVKANAYGCGLSVVAPALHGCIDMYGVACLEEALAIRSLGIRTDCLLLQGIFEPTDWQLVVDHGFQAVIHQPRQLEWLLSTPLKAKVNIWVKVNTGMQRLGFAPEAVYGVIQRLLDCSWVDAKIGVLTHFACADEPDSQYNQKQIECFRQIPLPDATYIKSMANSAAILALPESHADVVRPGIMLYGVSPFSDKTGRELGLLPVMQLKTEVTTLHHYPPYARVGYGGTWFSDKPSTIGVLPIGYGDGYPRHVAPNTPVWVNGYKAPIVGRVSMDMLTIDLTHCPGVRIGDSVELFGKYIPIEVVAQSAGTIGYELLCQVTERVR